MVGFKNAEVEKILTTVSIWAKQQPEICAAALVGSWARNEAHENSDIDLMFLTTNPELFFQNTDWFNQINWHEVNLQICNYYDRTYGVVRSRHLCFVEGQRIEFGFGYSSWAEINPIDPGTLLVVSSGMEIIYDSNKLLMTLQRKAISH